MLIAVACVGFAVAEEGRLSISVGKLSAFLLFPLVLIWFPDELGSVTGYIGRGGRIDTETPPMLVSGFGWLLLIGIPAIACYHALP